MHEFHLSSDDVDKSSSSLPLFFARPAYNNLSSETALRLIFIAVLLTNTRSVYRALSLSFTHFCTVLPQRFFNVWRHLDHTHIYITLHYQS